MKTYYRQIAEKNMLGADWPVYLTVYKVGSQWVLARICNKNCEWSKTFRTRSEAVNYGDAYQIVTVVFADWIDTTSFAGQAVPGEQWDTEDAWPSADTMRHARKCYEAFMAGDLETARAAMVKAQEAFDIPCSTLRQRAR